MSRRNSDLSLSLQNVQQGAIFEGVQELILETDAGNMPARFHEAGDGDAAVVWVHSGCPHGLDECRDEVDSDLLAWLRTVLHAH
jgi:hypothetical protein